MISSQTIKRGAAAGTIAGMLAIAVPVIGSMEGVSYTPYRDLAGVLTICHGETEGVKLGQIETAESCSLMMKAKLKIVGARVDSMVQTPMSNERFAGLVSLSYNIGLGAFKGSTLLKRLNNKDPKACDEIMRWTYVAGKNCTVKSNGCYGIVARRKREKLLCEAS
ncbi:lysozyme [Dyadobacter psychrotolerans]|uniref:Lysozyme n=1 Tax=Dyadobacter psychrotolerans TaxID=2541721 RepID=A0A4R5DTI4_9BACT|nr:lysozyme [Dyadobacter psychrotolerans]TDE17729.1 lysozyme [Dyadobacter psychrotolerans]